MIGLDPDQVIELLGRWGPVVRLRAEERRLLPGALALARAGVRAVELEAEGAGVPMRALHALRETSLLVGVGGLVTAGEAAEAARGGAAWVGVMSPEVEAGGKALCLVTVRSAADLPLAHGLARVAPPLRRGPRGGWCAEVCWPERAGAGAVFEVVAGGLVPQGLVARGAFGALEEVVRRRLGLRRPRGS